MKKLTLLAFMAMILVNTQAQSVTSISENLDVACVTTTGFPGSWAKYNPPSTTYPMSQGQWQCMPTGGNGATPGISCTGIFSGTPHLDTSYLVTPSLDLHGYSGNIYLNFDAKTDTFHTGGELHVLIYSDSLFVADSPSTDVTLAITPLISITDSTHWVTHQVDLTPFKASPFYVAFRYTVAATTGNMWHLDNINTTGITLAVLDRGVGILPLTVIGNSTPDKITLSYTGEEGSRYHLSVYDLLGREMHQEMVAGRSGATVITINDLNLKPGMYVVKMGNEYSFNTAKLLVQ
jgi:hypothetical protein